MKTKTILHFWKTSSIKQKLLTVGILALLSLGALGAMGEFSDDNQGGILSGIAETIGLKEKSSSKGDSLNETLTPPNGTLQLSKEYVYAGSRMVATEDYGITANGTPTNLALGKNTYQSSTVLGGVSSRAVDGNTSGNWVDNSITHTEYTPQPYWEVDLGNIANITQIKLWNRTDGSTERLSNLRIFVSDVSFATNDYNNNQAGMGIYNFPGTIGVPSTIDINRTGRYVRVQLGGTDYLSLAEVQIFGTVNPNSLSTLTLPVSGSYYQLKAKHSNKCADVAYASQNNGETILQWDCHGGPNQAWKFIQVSDAWEIRTGHSNKCIDVWGSSQNDGAQIIQFDCHGGLNQQWQLVQVGDAWRIVSKNSNKVLEVTGGPSEVNNWAGLRQWEFLGAQQTNQLWTLNQVPTP
jgi:hypothetical protein